MKNKLKQYLRSGILYFGILFLLWNCESENIGTHEGQQDTIKTVSLNEAVDFFKVKTSSGLTKPANPTYVISHLDHISQEEIINSNALLTVIPATTIYKGHYSRILLLKINNKIQSIVFNMYASGDVSHEQFSGEIIITDLNGSFLNGYRVRNGEFVVQFRKTNTSNNTSVATKTSGAVCPDHGECVEGSNCIVCLQELEEVVVTGGDSGNNGGPTPFIDLNDFPGIDEGGAGGPDMGMGWDYGSGEGVGPDTNNENYEEQIVIDSTFANTKTECIYNKLKAVSAGFANAIKKFDGDFPVAHLKFSMNDLADNKRGRTLPPENYVIEIQLNNDNSVSGVDYRPNLLTAKTIIHEVIHAEMFRKMLSIFNNGGDFDGLTAQDINTAFENGDYPGMLDYYTRYGINGFQHQQMAAHYRETIGSALQEFNTGVPVPGNQAPQQLYMDLAWEGLNHSTITAWQNALSQQEKDRIDQAVADYTDQYKNENCQ